MLPLPLNSPEFYLNEHLPTWRKFKPLPPTSMEKFEITTLLNVYPVVKSYYPLIEGSFTALSPGSYAIKTAKKCPEYLPFIMAFLVLASS